MIGVTNLQEHRLSEFYASGITFTFLQEQRSSTASKKAEFDFLVTTLTNKRIYVKWVETEALLRPDLKKYLESMMENTEPSKYVFMLSRVESTLQGFSVAQLMLRDAGFRIVPVTDISSVAFVLDWLDQTTGGARVKVTPTQEHAAALVNACCTIPQLGKKTCLEKVLPQANSMKKLAEIAPADLDDTVLAGNLFSFFNDTLEI